MPTDGDKSPPRFFSLAMAASLIWPVPFTPCSEAGVLTEALGSHDLEPTGERDLRESVQTGGNIETWRLIDGDKRPPPFFSQVMESGRCSLAP
jgi:hypothetical protein